MLVSAIIPTYNRAGTIERAVNSVLAQTWKPIEVIVVDDGSKDQTVEVLAKYGDKIRVIRQANAGPSAARNAGIKAARGEIITFLDSDDAWLPEKTERQVKLLERTESAGVKCCICNTRMEFASGTTTSFAAADLNPGMPEGIWTNPAAVLTTRFLLFNQVVAVRRKVLDEAGYFRTDLRLNEDYDIGLRIALMGPWAFITEPLMVWYASQEMSLSRDASVADRGLTVYDILKDLGHSPRWGPLFPKTELKRRLRTLRQDALAFRLSSQSSALARLSGKFLLLYLRGRKGLYHRGPFFPRMIAREV